MARRASRPKVEPSVFPENKTMAATLPCRGVVSDMLDPASHLQRLPAVSVPWCHDKGNPQSAHGISLRRTPVRQGDSLDPGFWQPARLFREFIQIALRPVPPAHMKCVALRLSVSHARTPGRSRAQSALGNFQGFPQIARDQLHLGCGAGVSPACRPSSKQASRLAPPAAQQACLSWWQRSHTPLAT